ncbi:MAG: AbrB/MazE/SpoVT family DNA-binding domain-containing protein [Chloroflexi bacterium]|nr:AbrB/MazE/SpoVT family DNA-binding domain-containing protein [Chloroflexota bacterium]
MTTGTAKIDSAGRILIPASSRKRLGVKPGDQVVMLTEGDSLRIMTRRAALKRAREFADRYFPRDRRLAEELIKERREEARREQSRP